MKTILTLFIFFLTSSVLYCQPPKLFVPREIEAAIANGTRTQAGIPGEHYFVNKVNYNIKAAFDPETKILTGQETILYENNSKDSLSRVLISLYQNLLEKGNARDWDAGATDLHNGVEIQKLWYNGRPASIQSDRVNNNRSLLQIELPEKIPPYSKASFEIAWRFPLPDSLQARYGKFGEGNYLIAYWYPKIAVYDDLYGWDRYPFTGNQEFYNDPGDYTVEITVPGEYNVCSSGILENPGEIYTPKILDRIKLSEQGDSIINIVTPKDWEDKSVLKASKTKVWKFMAEDVPDFAFAMSNHYLWDATSLMSGNRSVTINCYYQPSSKEAGIAAMAQESVAYFTQEIPAIPYPFPQLSVFESTGMEFPALAGCVVTSNKVQDFITVAHEISHAYFPFKTGLNEQKYAWMDEGLATFYPLFVTEKNLKLNFHLIPFYFRIYNDRAGGISDVPPMVPSLDLSDWDTYTCQAYFRSSTAFYELFELLGKEKFVQGLQLFYKTWEDKHPTPYDMFTCFNKVAGEDLSWFWKPWFFDFGFPDLSIGAVTQDKEQSSIRIFNKGGFPVPIKLKLTYKQGKEKQVTLKADIWKGDKKYYDVIVPGNDILSIVLDTQTEPDISPGDNTLKTND